MKPLLPAKLLKTLAPWRNAPAWHIAFSGGLDSTVLLHLLANLAKTEELPTLGVVHVHHGLQAAADAWPGHCQSVCDALGVPLRVMRVQVLAGASLERAARDARYQAFSEVVGAGAALLTGQHRDDQAETLLFRLLRGAGVQGLAAMPMQRPLAGGHLLRPLLGSSRAELQAYAQAHELTWIEDPSNADPRFSRNSLRHWLNPLTRLPDSDHWAGWHSLRDAKLDAQPLWRLADGDLHRCGERIWWLPSSWSEFSDASVSWAQPQNPLELPGNGQLRLSGQVPDGVLQVRYRQGGEIIDIPGRGRRDLKRLLNESGLPGFVRGRLPLLYRGEQLLAAPGLAGLWSTPNDGWQLHWMPQTCDQGLS